MKVTVEEMVQFVADHGDDYGLTMAEIEFVGVERVLDGIAAQCDARGSRMSGASFEGAPSYSAEQAMHDWFAESFGHAYDVRDYELMCCGED